MANNEFLVENPEAHEPSNKVYTAEDAPSGCRDPQRYADCRNATNPPNTGEHRACSNLYCK